MTGCGKVLVFAAIGLFGRLHGNKELALNLLALLNLVTKTHVGILQLFSPLFDAPLQGGVQLFQFLPGQHSLRDVRDESFHHFRTKIRAPQ